MAEKEYIEREAALKDYQTICNGVECARCPIRDKGHCKFEAYIRSIPAADVRPVKRARWRYKTVTVPGGKGQTYAKWCCTVCKGKAKERTNFCPNCGADMREES